VTGPCLGHTISRVSETATSAEQTGRDLARLLAAGDTDAVRQIYRAYGRLVFSIAHRILRDSGQAEDATQLAFTKLWQAADRVDPNSDIRPLLFTIVRRVAYDLSDTSRRRPWTPLQDVAEPSIEDDLDRLSTRWQVREAIDALPEEERDVIRLQHLDDLSHTEIAALRNVPIGTVKSRSFRAHKHLLALLGPLREEVS
jgi:RNA polymerase sigma-70 factor (ECF subfamily)